MRRFGSDAVVAVMRGTVESGGWAAFKRSLPRALRGRCPQCGKGALHAGRFRLGHACDHCGLVYRREQGAMTGSMYLSAAVTEVFAAVVAVGLFLFTDLGAAGGLAVGLPTVGLFCLWFLPYSRSIWIAVEYATDVSNDEDWVDPR